MIGVMISVEYSLNYFWVFVIYSIYSHWGFETVFSTNHYLKLFFCVLFDAHIVTEMWNALIDHTRSQLKVEINLNDFEEFVESDDFLL